MQLFGIRGLDPGVGESIAGEDLDLNRINTLDDLERLLELLGRFDIAEFEIKSEERKLRFAKAKPAEVAGLTVVSGAPGAPVMAPVGAAAVAPVAEEPGGAIPEGVTVIRSPMVGTFYSAPSPEADPFVQIGDRVETDTILCIIEAMKVMNEISAGKSGVVKENLVQNGESVEFNQPIFYLLAE